jgi:hypothetical protein
MGPDADDAAAPTHDEAQVTGTLMLHCMVYSAHHTLHGVSVKLQIGPWIHGVECVEHVNKLPDVYTA